MGHGQRRSCNLIVDCKIIGDPAAHALPPLAITDLWLDQDRVTKIVPSHSIPLNIIHGQGGRSWQPFGEGKNSHNIFRQVPIYYFATNALFLRVI